MAKGFAYSLTDNGVHVVMVSEGGDTTMWQGQLGRVYGPDGGMVGRYNTWDGFDNSVDDFKRVVGELNA